MDNPEILEKLFNKSTIRLIQLFLREKEKQFYLREISKETKIPIATTSRLLNKLLKLEILKLIKIKKFKLYELNQNNDVRFLERFLKKDTHLLEQFVDIIKDLKGIQRIILHGEEQKDRANIFLIGEEIDAGKIKETVGNLKDKSKFTVSALILTPEQYSQGSQMGLYSGRKKILFDNTDF